MSDVREIGPRALSKEFKKAGDSVAPLPKELQDFKLAMAQAEKPNATEQQRSEFLNKAKLIPDLELRVVAPHLAQLEESSPAKYEAAAERIGSMLDYARRVQSKLAIAPNAPSGPQNNA